MAQRLRAVVHRLDYAFRLGGGRFAVVRPGSEGGDASQLFDAFRSELAEHPIGEAGVVSVSGGIAELVHRDDVDSFVARAEAALAEAKRGRRGSAVWAGRRPPERRPAHSTRSARGRSSSRADVSGAPRTILGSMGFAIAVVLACAALVVLVLASVARRRSVARAERRAAALAEVAERIDAAVSSLGELSIRSYDTVPAPPNGSAPVPLVDTELPGRAGLVHALAEGVADARAEGRRLSAAVVRAGAGDATELAHAARSVADVAVFAVGPRAVALVLPGLGRADALGVLARIETQCSSSGRAVELESGEDAVELATRLLGPESVAPGPGDD